MRTIRKVCVVGTGVIGTAVSQAISAREEIEEILILARWEKVVYQINKYHQNKIYLPGIKPLSEKIRAAQLDFKKTKNADLIIISSPTSGVKEIIKGIEPDYQGQPIITLNKGMEARTQFLSHEIIRKEKHLHISGPAIGEELAKGYFTINSIAAFNLDLARDIGNQIETDNFRLQPTDDLIGVELCGVFKNILAIMMGMALGLKLSQNTQGTLFYEGTREARDLLQAFGAKEKTLFSSAWLGDIYLRNIRNIRFGETFVREFESGRFNPYARLFNLLAKWRKRKQKNFVTELTELYKEIFVDGFTSGMKDVLSAPIIVSNIINVLLNTAHKEAAEVEGIYSLPSLFKRNKTLGLRLPIVEELYKVFTEGQPSGLAINNILKAAQAGGK